MIEAIFWLPGEEIPTGDDVARTETGHVGPLRAVYLQGRDGAWSAYFPDRPGIHAGGATLDEARVALGGALALHES